jgi:hypothetical protein
MQEEEEEEEDTNWHCSSLKATESKRELVSQENVRLSTRDR